jgi:hypothetical protein
MEPHAPASSPTGPRALPRPTRRTVVRSAAWTVPVLATVAAAPAFAASPCAAQTIDFTSYTTGTAYTTGATFTAGVVTATLNLSGTTNATNNGTIFATTPSTKELRFYDANASNTTQTIKFTFSQAVTNLSVLIVDIDQSTNYDDNLVINTAGWTATLGGSVNGAGTNANPYQSSTGASVADGSPLAAITLKYASSTQFSITYKQGTGTITGNPHIGIRSMTFTPSAC